MQSVNHCCYYLSHYESVILPCNCLRGDESIRSFKNQEETRLPQKINNVRNVCLFAGTILVALSAGAHLVAEISNADSQESIHNFARKAGGVGLVALSASFVLNAVSMIYRCRGLVKKDREESVV